MKETYIKPTSSPVPLQSASLCLTSLGVDTNKETNDTFTSREGWSAEQWSGAEEEEE